MKKQDSYIQYNERQVFQPASFDADSNTVSGVLTTERAVRVFDWSRLNYIDEILMVDGMINRDAKVPLLDTHQRWEAKNVLGSSFDFRIENTEGEKCIVCKNQVSSTEDQIITKIREGHLNSTSVGYRVFESDSIILEPGQSVEYNGKTYSNDETKINLVIRKKWHIMENSIVPIGADDKAKLRAQNEAVENRIKENAQTDDQDIETSEPLKEPSFSSTVRGRILTFLKLKKSTK